MFDRPLTLGFTVYSRRFDFNQARQAAINAGQNLNLPQSVLNQLLNYNQSSTGFTASTSYLLGHSFKRVGLTYTLDNTTINTFSDASRNLFQTLNFRNISGPDALKGIVTSSLTPSFGFSTIDSPSGRIAARACLSPVKLPAWAATLSSIGLWSRSRSGSRYTTRTRSAYGSREASSMALGDLKRRPISASIWAEKTICAALTCAPFRLMSL